MGGPNPLLPAGYDVVWSVIATAVIALTVIALIILARAATGLAATRAWVWALVILLVPVLGAVAWIAIGRRGLPSSGRSPS